MIWMNYYYNVTFEDIYVTFMLCLKSWAYWLNLTYSVSCLHDMTVYSSQVKMQKITILRQSILQYLSWRMRQKKDIFIDNKKVIHLFKKKTVNVTEKYVYTIKAKNP